MPIKMIQWNCDGIRNKLGEFIEFVHEKEIDIILLQETKLRADHKLKLRGFQVYRRDGQNGQGGVAVAVKTTMPHRPIRLDPTRLGDVEAVAVQLADSTVVISYYNSPRRTLSPEKLHQLMGLARKVLIGGDLNARHADWGCRPGNRNGTILKRYTETNNLTMIHLNEPTHYPDNGSTPSTVDVMLAKNVARIAGPEAESLPSDHVPLLYTLNAVEKVNRGNRKVFDYSRANWRKFRSILLTRGR